MPTGRSKLLSNARGGLILLLALFWTLSWAGETPPYPASAPDFNLPDLDGRQTTLADLSSDNILIVFGATWCPHCQDTLPIIQTFARHIGPDLLDIVFVSVREKTSAVAEYAEKNAPPCKILLDTTGVTAAQYHIDRIPTAVFLDAQRRIQFQGRPNEDIIWRLLSGERPGRVEGVPPSNHRRDAPKTNAPRPASRRLIVELDEHPALAQRLTQAARRARDQQYRKAVSDVGARLVHEYGSLGNRLVVEVPQDKIEALSTLPRFKSLREDRPVRALLEDSAYQIHADYAWSNAITGQGVRVCVVDTGIDYTHPDLVNKVIAQYNPTDGSNDAMDDHAHGTHVAGIIASEGMQFRGVSYDVALMAVKALDYSGNGYSSDVILGINWCVDNGADVINLSLGEGLYSGTCDQEDMAQAVNAAVDKGVVVVCASGNDGDPQHIVSPACASKAIAVGAVDKGDVIASYSDGGTQLDLVAPGGGDFGGKAFPEIVSCFSTLVANDPFYCLYVIGDECYDNYFVVGGNRYIRAIGTSMATPHVAGAAALLLEANPELTPAQVRSVLQDNADDLGPPGWDNMYGWGRINLERALENTPAQSAELRVTITEPNTTGPVVVNEPFTLAADIECFGGNGCGHVIVHAQFSPGSNTDAFRDINDLTPLLTLDNNPNDLGILSGCTVDTAVPMVFDAATGFDISEASYAVTLSPAAALVGSVNPGTYNTGDLEPGDGLGAIGEDVEQLYAFTLPPGNIRKISVRLENYLVLHFNEIVLSGWYVYTSDAAGNNLRLIGDCIPAEGGGGEPQPPDCWFITEDPAAIADLNPGATSYIKLVSHDVGDDDWLTFNDIEVIVEYIPDPDNDTISRYTLKYDLSGVDTTADLGSAYLKLSISNPDPDAVGELYLIDPVLSAGDNAVTIHEANSPADTRLINPLKTFSAAAAGFVNLNVKAAVQEAFDQGKTAIAFQVRERNQDQLITLSASASAAPPTLTLSQTLQSGCPGQTEPGTSDPNSGPRPPAYDTLVVKDVSADAYSKFDNPAVAVIGAEFAAQYNTGDLEPDNGIGAIGEDAQKLYEFTIPEGVVRKIGVRLENYLVIHFNEIVLSGWYVYTADSAGNNLHLIGDCIPAEGGGGEPQPPDCWFITEDPAAIADLNPGATSYIKLVSHDVGDDDWLTFNNIEVIVDYAIDPNNDNVSRYYLTYDISTLAPNSQIDSAHLNVRVAEPAPYAVGAVHILDPYTAATGALTIFNAATASYSSLVNPIKTFGADAVGSRKINVKPAVEDAVESGIGTIAFLITENNEDTLFSLDTASGPNPPTLDIYLKSGISGGRARWTIHPTVNGTYTVRVLAENDVGIVGLSDARVITVFDPNLPTVQSVECLIGGVWKNCSGAAYNDTIAAVRVAASDAQGIPDVNLRITNIPDNHDFYNGPLPFQSPWFTQTLNLHIADSGQWRVEATATDSDSNTNTETIEWFIPWGLLSANILTPVTDVTVPKGDSFNVTAEVRCLQAECPGVTAALRLNPPIPIAYDDGSAEDYGDLGSTDSYIAVKFTPAAYPAQLRTARFYVWDQTTYPFELNVWRDNGPSGYPGAQLITPFNVDPVTTSAAREVAWFDVDLTAHNIIIPSGSFYVGWRQIESGKLNQVGFDTTGPLHRRTYGYLPALGGWFNLDDYCQYCSWLPSFCDFCGNIMIRAVTGEPGAYSGDLPTTPTPAPFYTVQAHPLRLPHFDAGDARQVTFTVRAVGAPGQSARLSLLARNNYSFDTDDHNRATITSPVNPCRAVNLDAVGLVDFKDLALLIQNWLSAAPPLPADTNSDNKVNPRDLANLADYWLTSCN